MLAENHTLTKEQQFEGAHKRKKQKGFSLIEILVVLAVIAILVGGIVAAVQGLNSDAEVSNEARNINTMSDRVKKMYGSSAFTGLTTAVAWDGGIFPDALTEAAGASNAGGIHSWKGLVTIASATLNGIANGGYAITYATVPGESCLDLVTSVEGRFDEITVAGTPVKAFNGVLNRATAATNCAANTVALVFTGS